MSDKPNIPDMPNKETLKAIEIGPQAGDKEFDNVDDLMDDLLSDDEPTPISTDNLVAQLRAGKGQTFVGALAGYENPFDVIADRLAAQEEEIKKLKEKLRGC